MRYDPSHAMHLFDGPTRTNPFTQNLPSIPIITNPAMRCNAMRCDATILPLPDPIQTKHQTYSLLPKLPPPLLRRDKTIHTRPTQSLLAAITSVISISIPRTASSIALGNRRHTYIIVLVPSTAEILGSDTCIGNRDNTARSPSTAVPRGEVAASVIPRLDRAARVRAIGSRAYDRRVRRVAFPLRACG